MQAQQLGRAPPTLCGRYALLEYNAQSVAQMENIHSPHNTYRRVAEGGQLFVINFSLSGKKILTENLLPETLNLELKVPHFGGI